MIYGIEKAPKVSVVRFENNQRQKAKTWQEGPVWKPASKNFETTSAERAVYQMPLRWSPSGARSAVQIAALVQQYGEQI